MPTPLPWWQTAVVYQIYPRSFADSNGDGIGDLEGIRSRLDHLADLGVDALWLSPIFPSPMADFGYDVADYCAVDPVFGSLADLDRLVAEAHERNLRVLLDWVPNHTSEQHPWFLESRSGRDSAKRDWYIWRDPAPGGGPPNNWVASFTNQSAWALDDASGQYYLHLFLPEQPDLNWANPEVEAAMHEVLRFWLDRGVDGFRVDVIHGIGKDPALPDDPPEVAGLPHAVLNDQTVTHEYLRRLRELVDGYPGDRMLVGEVYLLDTARVARYYGNGDELHLAFNFPPLYTRWRADKWRSQVDRAEAEIEPRGWPTWVLSNHDNQRHRTRYGSEARARAAAVLLLTLRGTPFLYAGEELGLEDAEIPRDRVVDPGGRDGCRAPIPWDASPDHGWGGTDPWLPWPPNPDSVNAEVERDDPGSMLHLYRRLLSTRRASPALQHGTWLVAPSPEDVLAYERVAGDDRRLVAVNFADEPRPFDAEGWTIELSTHRDHDGKPFKGALAADEAIICRPTP